MYWLVYFTVVVFLTKVSAEDSDKCMELKEYANQSITCCKVLPIKPEYFDKLKDVKVDYDNEECKQLPSESDPGKCSEKQMCDAKKLELTDKNGDIDEEAVRELFEEDLQDILDPKVYGDLMEHCFDQKPKKSESCLFNYLEYCTEAHIIMGCKEWTDDKSCDDIKSVASACAKYFS